MIDFSHRHPGPELMDDMNIPAPDLFQNYRELHLVNKWLGGYRITLKGMAKLLDERTREYSVLDVGCGGGDMLMELLKWGQKKNQRLQLTGIDLSEAAILYAKKNDPAISWIREDVFDHLKSGKKYDVIMNTLFMHHFSNKQIIELLEQMWQSANVGIIVNDLQRHPVAYRSIQWITKLFSRSYLVKHDAPLSVLRGFVKKEWIHLLHSAGITESSCDWQWAFRYLIVCKK